MTIDVNLSRTDEDFFDNLDDIIEDTMVQMFILHPKNASEIAEAQQNASEYESLFYSLPLHLRGEADENCVAFSISSDEDVASLPDTTKPLIVDQSFLNDSIVTALKDARGIILNATSANNALENFYVSLGAGTIGSFDTETLSALSMDRIVLQSSYPDHGFDEIFSTVKVISDAMFRPEQSIIARATKSSLELFGFRKS